jgi:hypothetical protein
MSLQNEWTEWHLTPRGWEQGSIQRDFEGETIVPAPEDRVMTFIFKEYQSCSFAKLLRNLSEEWRGLDQARVDELLAKFGKCPDHL